MKIICRMIVYKPKASGIDSRRFYYLDDKNIKKEIKTSGIEARKRMNIPVARSDS